MPKFVWLLHGKELQRSVSFYLAACMALLLCTSVRAQNPGDMNSTVAPALVGGNPAASRSESGVEHINLYNGNLNITVPLVNIDGRGNAGYSMLVPVQRRWNVETNQNQQPSPYSWNDAFSQLDFSSTPYSPGSLVIRRSGSSNQRCLISQRPADLGPYITRLIWVTPDGTETTLRDTQYDGQPQGSGASDCNAVAAYTPVSRGTTFAGMDGSDITFIADTAISDSVYSLADDGAHQTGWLYFPNGTKYRIDNFGNVASIIDRNGNTASLTYPDDDIAVTDALGRAIITQSGYYNAGAAFNNAAGLYEPSWDTVQYAGFGTAQRTIRINHASLADVSTNGTKTYQQLFPELTGADPTVFDPDVISSVVLPDSSSSYSFQYNEYGEVTQMTLPTGGVYRYYYQQNYSCPSGSGGAGGDGVISIANYAGKSVYRRLTERDELADGVNISGKTTYHGCSEANPDPNHSGRPETTVYVDRYDGNNNLLRHESHSFYGDPSGANSIPGPTAYAAWWDGMEFRTDLGDSASATRESRQMAWQQRPCGTSVNTGLPEPCWFGDPQADAAPSHDPQLCQANTTLDGGTTSGRIFKHDQYNNQTDLYEFDFGAAPAVSSSCASSPSGYLRNTHTDYQYASSYVQPGTHIWDLPAAVTLLDPAANQVAKRTLTYDAGGAQLASGITGMTPPTGPRGNATSDQQWWSVNNANIGHQYLYDVAGNAVQDTDANGNVTSLSYGDAQNTYAHLTGVTLPAAGGVAETMQMQYDYSTGFLTSFRDVNGAITSYSYNTNDPFDRLKGIARPDGGTSAFFYPSLTQTGEADDENGPSDGAIQTTLIYDGLHRLTQTWNLESNQPSGNDFIANYRGYDALGRVSWVGNPLRTTNAIGTSAACQSVLACTVTTYDGLNRVTSVRTPDQLPATAGYSGNSATVTDQAQTVRAYTMDGFGRLTQVVENPGSAAIATTYCFDLLDNLTAAHQPAATNCQVSGYAGQTRKFVYDSLSRLHSNLQPEAVHSADGSEGGNSYAYDNNGNLVWRQDNRGQQVCIVYDALNRPTQRIYFEGTIAAAMAGQCSQIPSSAYDPYTSPATYSYGTNGNATGLLTQISNAISVTAFSNFDAMGRVLNSIQGTAGYTYPFSYAYNLAGALTVESYPSGRVITMPRDSLNRPTQIQGVLAGQQPVTYAAGISYAPHGAVQSYLYGNQVTRTYSYNSRLQPQEIRDANPQATLLDLVYGWDGGSTATHNNGLVRSQQINTNASNFLQTFGYDGFNRLTTVTDSGGSGSQRTFQYDAYGNVSLSGNSGTFPVNSGTPPAGTQYSAANRLPATLATYDDAGNVTGTPNCPDCLVYDAENQLLGVTDGNTFVGYNYDGAGNRVAGSEADGTATIYAYDALNQLAAKYVSTPPPAPCTTCYLSGDQLGSTRLVTDQAGNVVGRHDYLPFGEEIPSGYAGRPGGWGALDLVRQKFTGQERDDFSGLDYFGARYYNFVQGRFMSPDPGNAGADLYNPQSWNGYAYVMNSPLSNVDPDGLDSCTATNCLSMGQPPPQPGQVAGSGGGFGFSFGWSFGGGSAPAVSTLSQNAPSSPQFQDRGGNGFVNNFVDAESGAFDVLSLGLTEHLRNEDGIAAEVHKDSNWYKIGIAAGFGLSFLDGGELLGGGEALVDTNAIRFTQSTVTDTFRDGRSLQATIDALRAGTLGPADIPAIRIFAREGVLYTLDNRRLLAAAAAGVKINVRSATAREIKRQVWKFTTKNGGLMVEVLPR